MSSGDIREPQSNDVREPLGLSSGRRPQSDADRQQAMFGVVLATTVAQVGCVTVIVILGGLVVGLGLDRLLGTRPIFTLVLVLASIPLSLFVLVRVALSATHQLAPPTSRQAGEESSNRAESPDREV